MLTFLSDYIGAAPSTQLISHKSKYWLSMINHTLAMLTKSTHKVDQILTTPVQAIFDNLVHQPQENCATGTTQSLWLLVRLSLPDWIWNQTRVSRSSHWVLNELKNNAWVTVNNDFWVMSEGFCQWFLRVTKSRVKIIGKSPHEWPQNRYSR